MDCAEGIGLALRCYRVIKEAMTRIVMFARSAAVVFLVSASLASAADETSTQAGSASWLREGSIATISILSAHENEMKNLSQKQFERSLTFLSFVMGFRDGLRHAAFQFPTKPTPQTLYWPDAWGDPADTAPQILAFMQKHKDKIDDDMWASSVLYAWILAEHPDSTAKDRILSTIILEEAPSYKD